MTSSSCGAPGFARPGGAVSGYASPARRALTGEAAEGISDLQFTGRYRVPFQFSRHVREHLKGGGFLQASAGVKVTDLDGNELYDLTGSYGVNVFGYDFYRSCIAEGSARVAGARAGARRLPSGGRRQRAPAAGHFRAGRGVLPHVRHRGGDAGGAPGPLSHGPAPSGALLRRLPRLVGGRAAGHRQPAAAARDLHA